MPIVTLKFKDNVLGEYPIVKGQSLTIGRKEHNDIAIENLAVSGHHAKIDGLGDGFLLTDLKSKNGSYVNRQRVDAHRLQNGDTIVIGKHTLVFTDSAIAGEAPPADTGGQAGRAATAPASDQHRQMLRTTEAAFQDPGIDASIGMLTDQSGGRGDVALTKRLTRVGKNSTCDIVVSGFMTGKIAFTVSKRPNGYSLNYVEGLTKPRVNGQVVRDSVDLEEFDTIELGSLKLQFFYK